MPESLKEQDKQSILVEADMKQQQGNIGEALELYQQIASSYPDFALVHDRLGLLNLRLGRYEESITHYGKYVELNGDFKSLANLGIAYFLGKNPEAAEDILKQSLELNQNPVAHLYLALICSNRGKDEEAEQHFLEVLKMDYGNVDANYNLGIIMANRKHHKNAIKYFERVLELNPKHDFALPYLLREYQNVCAWEQLSETWPKVKDLVEEQIKAGKKPGLSPFTYISINDRPEENLKLAQACANFIKKSVSKLAEELNFDFSDRRKAKDKITIGYLSADFRDHALGHISKYLFETHNKDRFRIIAYSTDLDDESDISKYYEETADKFVEIKSLNNEQAAARIYADGVDILCDCTGYTAGGRMEIAAMRPAPIQVNLWGFAGTIGADFMDYIIADKVVLPEEQQPYYAEKFVYLPDTLQINHGNEEISDKEFTRKDFDLPDDAFVFCSFNQPYKIEPVMFNLWMELLKEVEGSVLWLRLAGDMAEEKLKVEAEKNGVSANRIIFDGRMMDRPEYFKRIQLADLALDTRIYNGGSTTMDALWAGVPVVTMLGNHYASRMSAGIIKGTGMEELITNNLEEYKTLALELAKNPDELQKLRKKLWQQRTICPLFDIKRYAGNLEQAYERMWDNFIQGKQPEPIEV